MIKRVNRQFLSIMFFQYFFSVNLRDSSSQSTKHCPLQAASGWYIQKSTDNVLPKNCSSSCLILLKIVEQRTTCLTARFYTAYGTVLVDFPAQHAVDIQYSDQWRDEPYVVERYDGELVAPLGGDTDTVPQCGTLVGATETEVEAECGQPPDTAETPDAFWLC